MSYEEKRLESQETVLSSSVEKKNVNGSSIYRYLKAHPGSLAALISATIATISFVLNAALHRKISAYLSYWGFNSNNINIETGYQIYVIALAFVLCLAIGGLTWFLCQTFYVFQKRANVLLYLRIDNRYTFVEILKLRVDVLRLSVGVWFCAKRGIKGKAVDDIKANVVDCRSRLKELSAKIKSRKRTLWLLRCSNVITLLPSLLIVYGLSLLLMSLTDISEKLKAIIPYPVLALSVVVLLLIGLVYYAVRFEFGAERKRIKKAFKNDYESAYKTIEELAEQSNKQYPVMQIVKSKAEELFNNRVIAILAILLVVSLLFAFSSFSVPDEDTISGKKTFLVVNIEGQDYVITYICGTTYYLNQAEVNYGDNTIVISTMNQRVIVSEDMRYGVVKFESVKIESGQEG
jgi:hypothetical protein